MHEALVAADAVLDVHDEVARREAAQVLEERARRVGRARALAAAVRARAEDLLLGDEHEAVGRQHDAARERADDDLHLVAAALVEPRRVERREARLARDALVAEERDEPLGLRLRARGDEDAQPVLAASARCGARAARASRSCPCDARAAFTARVEVVVVARGEIERRRARASNALEPALRLAPTTARAVERDHGRARRGRARSPSSSR